MHGKVLFSYLVGFDNIMATCFVRVNVGGWEGAMDKETASYARFYLGVQAPRGMGATDQRDIVFTAYGFLTDNLPTKPDPRVVPTNTKPVEDVSSTLRMSCLESYRTTARSLL